MTDKSVEVALDEAAAAAQPTANLPRTATAWIIFAIAVAFSVFQIYTAAFNPLSSLVVRSIHVGFLLILAFLLFGIRTTGQDRRVPWYDWALGITGFLIGFYHWIYEAEIVLRVVPTTFELIIGSVMVALVFEAARRAMGLGLTVVCGLFLIWGMFGELLPAPFDHRGYGLDQMISQLYLSTEGVFGTPIFVSATYLFLFILFGTFLQQAGMLGLFNDLALGSVGHTRGGPAKVAVVSSGIMGTISGSGIANVVTTGMFTIPLMKRFGYRATFAGAVEATASMGGQIMPPVMGAVAFIMAETIGVPYVEVVKAAIIPAMLYFGTVLWMVHLEAGRLNLMGLPKSALPSPLRSLKERWFLLMPLVALIYLLFSGYTPLFAGTIGLLLTAVLILGTTIARQFGPIAVRIVFWIFIGIAASAFFRFGVSAVFTLIGLLAVANFIANGGRDTLKLTVISLAEGAKNAVGVGIACAVVGVIIAVMTLTGLPITVGSVIVDLAETSLFLALFLTMLTCIVLGMGIPTIPNYIITSSIAGPVLLQLGVPLIVSHMFVFYFGIMANLTPPVALAAFAAAPIAQAPPMRISLVSLRIAVAGFVVPFMAVYTPALMLQDGGPLSQAITYPGAVAYIVFKACISVGLWGAAAIGYLFTRLSPIERLWATAGAFFLVVALPITDEIGLALSVSFLLFHWWRSRRTTPQPG